ncbi:hypothetical protein ACTHAM_002371 [Cellulomonas soli]|uniref:hypothetical protein n=1 Tax=Cellulomonas soli TaxID=931535 RepID=UPI003F82A528
MTPNTTPADTAVTLLADIRDITAHQGATSPRLADALAARGWVKTTTPHRVEGADIANAEGVPCDCRACVDCPATEPATGYPCTADVAGHTGPHGNVFGTWHTPDSADARTSDDEARDSVDYTSLAAALRDLAAGRTVTDPAGVLTAGAHVVSQVSTLVIALARSMGQPETVIAFAHGLRAGGAR